MLEEENLYQRSTNGIIVEDIAPIKTDLMKDLDEKYRKLQGKYNHLGNNWYYEYGTNVNSSSGQNG